MRFTLFLVITTILIFFFKLLLKSRDLNTVPRLLIINRVTVRNSLMCFALAFGGRMSEREEEERERERENVCVCVVAQLY